MQVSLLACLNSLFQTIDISTGHVCLAISAFVNGSAAATQADAVATLLSCLTAVSGNPSSVSKSLKVLKSLLATDSSKCAFMRANGASQLADLLSQQSSKQDARCMLNRGNTRVETLADFCQLTVSFAWLFCYNRNSDSGKFDHMSYYEILLNACAAGYLVHCHTHMLTCLSCCVALSSCCAHSAIAPFRL